MYLIFWALLMIAKMIIEFSVFDRSPNPWIIYCTPSWAICCLLLVVNPFINFEVTGQNVILYGCPIWNRNGNGSSRKCCSVELLPRVIASLSTVLLSPAISSQSWWQTDRQTDTHTDRQTEWKGEKHNTFFQRYNNMTCGF